MYPTTGTSLLPNTNNTPHLAASSAAVAFARRNARIADQQKASVARKYSYIDSNGFTHTRPVKLQTTVKRDKR